jgi:AAA+ superfamily predicted ATPase
MEGFASGMGHLLAELQRLDCMLQRQVLRLRAANLITEDQWRGLYIPDAQVDVLLHQRDPRRADQQPYSDDVAGAQVLTAHIERMRQENAARAETSRYLGTTLPLQRLAELFQLTSFEVEVLLICVAPELDLRYETLYAYVQNDATKKRPSVDLALKLLCPTFEERLAHRAAFAVDGALFRHHLVRLFDDPQDREPALMARFMKADERVVNFLLGTDKIDSRLLPFAYHATAAHTLSALALPHDLIVQLTHATQSCLTAGAVFFFHGPAGVGKQAAAEAICAELGQPLLVAELGPMLASDVSLATLAALLRREAVLQGAGIFLSHYECLLADSEPGPGKVAALASELARPDLLVFLGSEVPWHPDGAWAEVRFLSFTLPLPAFPLRLRLWQHALSNNGHCLEPDVDVSAVANKFTLSPGQVERAARRAGYLTVLRTAEQRAISNDDLHTAARTQSSQGLRRLAQKIEPMYTWDDLVLPPRALRQLRQVCASVKYRHVVYTHWGFDRKLALGKGLNVLFSGASGTGKTMAAQILASELSLDLYKIDLSSVVSKYIGETEKNLSRIFHEAQASNAILFFDEADALFGKRSEVKDAHDRYANVEVAYLLQKMEEYEGMVVLATNLSKNLDEAFARRMHHTVEFPFPDASYRERIWRGLFPAAVPLADDVDFGFLARQFDLAGGNIRNVALAAAFMAAEDGHSLGMEHLILATARELQKISKLPSKADFRDYYELIREWS